MKPKYSLASNTWDYSEIEAINRVLQSGMYTMGAEVSRFEDEFAKFVGVDHAIMVNSGSSANLIACAAIRYSKKFRPLGTVIVPAVSWSTTFYPLHQMGYTLKFVDIDIKTLNIDIEEVVKNITSDVVGICGVSLLGNPFGMDRLRQICDENDLFFYEDNCESFGASINDRLAGSFGHISSHSFFFSHHLQTMEGGMICTNDVMLAALARSLRAHGWTRDKKSGDLSDKSFDDFNKSFEFVLPGYCVRPIEFMGAVGQEQLRKWPKMKSMRLKNARLFLKILGQFEEIIQPQCEGNSSSSWFGFSMILKNEAINRRNDFIEILNRNGIEYRPVVAGNFTRQKVLRYLNHKPLAKYPNADLVHENGIFVGNDARDLSNELDLLRKSLEMFLRLIRA